MPHKIDDHAEPICPTCATAMVLVRIVPRVASFTELRIYRCFACDDLRGAGPQKTVLTRVNAVTRCRYPRAA